MKKTTIQLQNLSTGYREKGGNKLVSSNISADIESDELTCLIGANGIGKSTLMRTLAAFQPKLSGEIVVQGKEIDAYTDKELARIISVVLTLFAGIIPSRSAAKKDPVVALRTE